MQNFFERLMDLVVYGEDGPTVVEFVVMGLMTAAMVAMVILYAVFWKRRLDTT